MTTLILRYLQRNRRRKCTKYRSAAALLWLGAGPARFRRAGEERMLDLPGRQVRLL